MSVFSARAFAQNILYSTDGIHFRIAPNRQTTISDGLSMADDYQVQANGGETLKKPLLELYVKVRTECLMSSSSMCPSKPLLCASGVIIGRRRW